MAYSYAKAGCRVQAVDNDRGSKILDGARLVVLGLPHNAMSSQIGDLAVVGTRTRGGVLGIDLKYELVDGTMVAQPKYAWWFADVGWAVENHGVDPDVEVTTAPHDWAAGRDPQLGTAIRLALQAPEQRTPAAPPTV